MSRNRLSRNKLFSVTTFVVLVVSQLQFAVAQEWTRFRGPNGSGISEAKTVPTKWTTEDANWIAKLPGRGHSSPVVWGDQLFVTSANEKSNTRALICLHTGDGSIKWTKESTYNAYKKHKNNSYASSTPAVDADHVYVIWHSKKSTPLIAFDHSGKKVWEYDLGPYLHGQGGAASPIVHENLVVIANDHKADSFLLAVDRRTGKEQWKIPRDGKRACYTTPCIFTPNDRPAEIIFSHCFEGIIGVDPTNGKTNWHIDVFGRASQRALGSPVVTDNLVIASSGGVGGGKQVVAVSPTKDDNKVAVAEAFRVTRQAPHVPTPLIYKDWIFLWADDGIVSCLNKDTGKVVWKERIGGNFFGSPICVDGKLCCISLDGEFVVVKASDEFELLARIDAGNPSKSTPAVSGGVLYVRTESTVISIGGKK
jgi:outer membrane protein assembly factor BamB